MGRVGVDVEQIREIEGIDVLMRYFFTNKELNRVNNEVSLQRLFEFYSVWTRKEAIGKMFGLRLSDNNKVKQRSKYSVKRIKLHEKYAGALSFEY